MDEKKPETEQNEAWKAWFVEWKKSKEETDRKAEQEKDEFERTTPRNLPKKVHTGRREALRKGRER